MKFAASHNSIPQSARAVEDACAAVLQSLAGDPPDVAFLFVSADHAAADELAALVSQRLGCRHLLGCTAETVVGGAEELERGPALSLWAAHLPGVDIHPFHVTFASTPDGVATAGLPTSDVIAGTPSAAFVLGDPFSTSIDSLIAGLADEFSFLPLLGGMASAARQPGSNRLYLDGQSLTEGAAGLLLGPGVSVRSVVSQGCRPVGTTYVVTRAERNVLFEIGGRPALERLQETYSSLGEEERELFQRGPHVGVAMNEYQATFGRGDFLIANVIGADREVGAVAIGNHVRTGQTIQFHVRDADTADEDLRSLLGAAIDAERPQGALLFSCNGRGTHMFAEPDHDAAVIQEVAGPLPLAGLFAQGELGPIGGRNHIHGFTASIALFGAPSA